MLESLPIVHSMAMREPSRLTALVAPAKARAVDLVPALALVVSVAAAVLVLVLGTKGRHEFANNPALMNAAIRTHRFATAFRLPECVNASQKKFRCRDCEERVNLFGWHCATEPNA